MSSRRAAAWTSILADVRRPGASPADAFVRAPGPRSSIRRSTGRTRTPGAPAWSSPRRRCRAPAGSVLALEPPSAEAGAGRCSPPSTAFVPCWPSENASTRRRDRETQRTRFRDDDAPRSRDSTPSSSSPSELAALAARRRPRAPAELEAVALGGAHLPAGRQAGRRLRGHAEVRRQRAADRDRRRDAGDRPRAAAAAACRAPRSPGSSEHLAAAISRRLDAAGPGHRRAPTRTRSATAGTTRGCSPRGRRTGALVPSPMMRAMRDGHASRASRS